jgi:hypothetical protein
MSEVYHQVITIDRGFAWKGRLLVGDRLTGQPASLVGVGSTFKLFASKAAVAPLLTKSLGSGIAIIGGGVLEVSLSAAETAALAAGVRVWEWAVVDAAGDKMLAAAGAAKVVDTGEAA